MKVNAKRRLDLRYKTGDLVLIEIHPICNDDKKLAEKLKKTKRWSICNVKKN